jgi:hypothetical protein
MMRNYHYCWKRKKVSPTPPRSREHIAAALLNNSELAQYKDERDYYEKVGNNGKMLDWMYGALPPAHAPLGR